MYRPSLAPVINYHWGHRWPEFGARWLVTLTLWICVFLVIKSGYYGKCNMVLGPSSSRLFEASSIFVKQVQIRDYEKKGVYLYGFSEKPELTLETNWSVSNYVIVKSYSRKGFSLWLNKGSRIKMRWEAQTSSLGQLQVYLIKGERDFETLLPTSTNFPSPHALNEAIDGREAEYTVEEDNKYCIDVMSTSLRSIIMVMSVNVSSRMYDTTKAKSMCSTIEGSCRLNLLFPKTQFVTVTTPDNGDLDGWRVELSFVARIVTYTVILGFSVLVLYLILKSLGTCDGDNQEEPAAREITETNPLIPDKPFLMSYGTYEADEESGSSSSSEDLYDGKICVICYDVPRNCFFVPCGHCATCYDCAQRIMDGENKVCPICRRLIHKVRKLIIP